MQPGLVFANYQSRYNLLLWARSVHFVLSGLPVLVYLYGPDVKGLWKLTGDTFIANNKLK